MIHSIFRSINVSQFRSFSITSSLFETKDSLINTSEQLEDIIINRRSTRAYTEDPISDEIVHKIIEMGNWAPSGRNLQPLKYYICTDQDLLNEISLECMKGYKGKETTGNERSIFHDAPVCIFVTWKDGIIGDEYLDSGVSFQNMQLYAHSLGIGSCMIGLTKYGSEYIEKTLSFEEDEVYCCALVCGYPDTQKKLNIPKRKESNIEYIGQREDDDL